MALDLQWAERQVLPKEPPGAGTRPVKRRHILQGLIPKVILAYLKFTSNWASACYLLNLAPSSLVEGTAPSHQVLETAAHRWPCCRGSAWGQHLILAPLSPGCSPTKCGRGVTDAVISRDEARRIRRYDHASPNEQEKWAWGGEQRLTTKKTI